MSRKSAAAVVCMVAGLSLLTGLRAASAADECLTEPKGPTAQGQHWYYHLERGTGRRCWYQRGQDDAAATTTADDQSAATDDDDASSTKDQVAASKDQAPALPVKPPAKQIAKKIEPPPTRSLADARAELPAKARVDDTNAAPPAAVAPAPTNAPSASVWPDPQAALAAKPVVDASSSDTETQPDTTASTAPEASSAPVTQPASPGDRPPGDRQLANRHPGSIAKLLLVAFGALALAGLTGSTVYRLASVRRRVRPEDRWSRNIASRNITMQPAPARRPQRHISARPEPVEHHFVQDDVAREEFEQDEFEHADFEQEHFEPERLPREPVRQMRVEPRGDVTARTETRASDPTHRRQQIEAYLMQLTRQLQADLEGTVRAE
jgi:hypothetical protein